jgi:hypothetical protein
VFAGDALASERMTDALLESQRVMDVERWSAHGVAWSAPAACDVQASGAFVIVRISSGITRTYIVIA